MTNFHLILDTSLKQGSHGNFLFHFDKLNIEGYTKIKLSSFYIQHEIDVQKVFHDPLDTEANRSLRPLHVHCSLLNKDFNYMNGKKSDVLAVIYPALHLHKAHMTNFVMRMDTAETKAISPCSYMQLQLTHSNGESIEKRGKFYVVYEFEFSQ
jgi:hypothetical protein